jgi:tryptophanyl-tRNA synthetase
VRFRRFALLDNLFRCRYNEKSEEPGNGCRGVSVWTRLRADSRLPPRERKTVMKKIILTGDRPTGRLHVGHYVGSLRRRVELQNSGEFDKILIMIADAQALTDNADNPEKVRQNIIEVALDYLSCGLDPTRSTLLIQSQIPELTELSFYYMNLVTVSRLQRNPTVKSEIQMRNFETSIPVGFFTYPISQAADITAFRATTVPAGEDQEPMIEQTKEIVRKFNAVYGETLVEPEILLPNNKACLRLPGIDGKAKMSKSLGNCIYLSDPADEVKKKVMSMFTDPNHLQVSDPGQVEGNPVFIYLDAFCRDEHFAEFFRDYQNLDEMKAHYTRGGLGDVKVKKFLVNVLQESLEPIRQRRREFEKDIPEIYRILKKGSEDAREIAAQTLSDVKAAMKINYFDDEALIAEQSKRFSER